MLKVQKQQGFTLIELIIVIVILGILAVTAAPRFLDLSDQAEQAAAEGVQGAVNSASSTFRAAWLTQGATGTTVSVEGINVTVENDGAANQSDGYPVATDAGIGSAVEISNQWDSDPGASAYIFVGANPFPTDNTNDGAPCVSYSLNADDRPVTATGMFAFVSAGNSTCS